MNQNFTKKRLKGTKETKKHLKDEANRRSLKGLKNLIFSLIMLMINFLVLVANPLDSTPDLKPVSLKVNGNLYQNQTGSFTATLKNNGTVAYNSRLWIYMEKPVVYSPNQLIGGDIFYFAPGETKTITITGIITLSPDSYCLNMVFDANNNPNKMNTYQFHGADFGGLSVNIKSDTKSAEHGKQPQTQPTMQQGSKQSDIVGEWKGSYGHGMELTLIIYDDMKGASSCFLLGTIASHTVLAEYSNGRYNVIGEKWINRPSGLMGSNFTTLNGVIKNDVFSGKDFQLKRVATAKQVQEQRGERERQIAELEKQQQAKQKELEAPKFEINYPYKQEIIISSKEFINYFKDNIIISSFVGALVIACFVLFWIKYSLFRKIALIILAIIGIVIGIVLVLNVVIFVIKFIIYMIGLILKAIIYIIAGFIVLIWLFSGGVGRQWDRDH